LEKFPPLIEEILCGYISKTKQNSDPAANTHSPITKKIMTYIQWKFFWKCIFSDNYLETCLRIGLQSSTWIPLDNAPCYMPFKQSPPDYDKLIIEVKRATKYKSSPVNYWSLCHKPRRWALILNYQVFPPPADFRLGSGEDVKYLKKNLELLSSSYSSVVAIQYWYTLI
jgi:hypothetical protein